MVWSLQSHSTDHQFQRHAAVGISPSAIRRKARLREVTLRKRFRGSACVSCLPVTRINADNTQ